MEPTFWHERWSKRQIGFHQPQAEAFLTAHFRQLRIPRGATVFVPLCGKSLDLLWLADQGYKVVGVELSPIACEEFFSENSLPALAPVKKGRFRVHRAKNLPITLYEGDFFDLGAEHTGPAAAFYDRASVIALPSELRRRYAQHLQSVLLAPKARGLLLTTTYDQSARPGPPFSISEEEARSLFGEHFRLKLAEQGHEVIGADRFTSLKSAWLLSPATGTSKVPKGRGTAKRASTKRVSSTKRGSTAKRASSTKRGGSAKPRGAPQRRKASRA